MKKLILGNELSKNEQKKVAGGVHVTCRTHGGGEVTAYMASCSIGMAYCNGAHAGFLHCCP